MHTKKKQNKAVILLILMVLMSKILAAQIQSKPIINADLSGIVLDSITNLPLEGVTLQLEQVTHQVKSDAKGHFNFITGQKLPLTLTISRIGYHTKRLIVQESPIKILLEPSLESISQVVVTSRRRSEKLQDIPIPITTINGKTIDDAGAFTVGRIKEMIPSVQLYSSNPRNTTLNIRGLGSTFGLKNDGIDPGVGFYLDGVYMARPAATALDFIDIDQIEVLRGPQGTLFGMNTTSGAFNITSKLPKFESDLFAELSYGNYGLIQGKASISGPITKKLAARFSFSGTQRNGTMENLFTNRAINSTNNLGFRGQFLYKPIEKINILIAADRSIQKPDGFGWGVAGVVKTQRADYRQFNNIISDIGYKLPYSDAFDRKVDLNTESKADNELGGVSVNADVKIGSGTLTSTSAWRYWKWVPLNDRDYLGLPIFTISSGTSSHDQFSQEFRYSGNLGEHISAVIGLFGLYQNLRTDPVHTEEAGSSLWRFAKNSESHLWETPGLFDHFGIKTNYGLKTTSLAVYSQLDWAITSKFHILPGIRFNYDHKDARYDRKTYGGLQTEDPELLALKNGIYTNQAFQTDASASNFSGQLSLQYKWSSALNAFATYALSYKPIGINVGGLPTANGQVLLDLARVKPEGVQHKEIGIKSTPFKNSILNFTVFQTDIKDYQTLVQTPEPGVNRGYLANAEKVRVKGLEVDGNFVLSKFFSIKGSLSYTDGKYLKFTNAPVPLEEVGGKDSFKDISGGRLPGISKWSTSLGAEGSKEGQFLGYQGSFFIGVDLFYRSEFSSSPSPSQYLNIQGYTLLHGRLGYRANNGVSIIAWSRNLTNKNYYEQLLAAPGSYGQYVGVIGDPQTYGITLRYTLK